MNAYQRLQGGHLCFEDVTTQTVKLSSEMNTEMIMKDKPIALFHNGVET